MSVKCFYLELSVSALPVISMTGRSGLNSCQVVLYFLCLVPNIYIERDIKVGYCSLPTEPGQKGVRKKRESFYLKQNSPGANRCGTLQLFDSCGNPVSDL